MTAAFSGALEALRDLLSGVPGLGWVTYAPYAFRPFVLVVVLALVVGPVSTIVNLRRLEFNAEAMVHSVFPGVVAAAVWWGTRMIIPGAALAAVAATCALVAASRSKRENEAATAVVLATFFSIGVIISLRKGDMSGQLEALMFGRLMEMSDERLMQSLIVCALALAALALTWKEQVFVAHDRDGARVAGVRVLAVDVVINAAIGAVVVAASAAIGVLLVIGYVVVPGVGARLAAPSATRMSATASGIALVGALSGLALMNAPTARPISPQAALALTVIAVSAVVGGWGLLRERLRGADREPAAAAAEGGERTAAAPTADSAQDRACADESADWARSAALADPGGDERAAVEGAAVLAPPDGEWSTDLAAASQSAPASSPAHLGSPL